MGAHGEAGVGGPELGTHGAQSPELGPPRLPRAPLRLVESSWAAPRLAAPGPPPPGRPGPGGTAPLPCGAGGGVRGAGWRPGGSRRRPARPRHAAPCSALRALLGPPGHRHPRRLLGGRLQLERQATPHPDISRRVASFRFETHEDRYPELPPQAHGLGADGVCRPCSDAELLLTACTSDFVINGTIRGVAHNTELQESVITVAAARVLRQTLPLFRVGESGGQASIHTPLRCGVRPGPGAFLFMGWSRFAWTFPMDCRASYPCLPPSPHRRASRQRPEEEEMGVLS
ncbi:meteorin isoform X3 [Acinonyx jubatus]|uniref:Meteorin isoform X3 n=1 Tax=Acinonyx jubatus TaxID=32536 RepID=A0ABM3PCJ0_ACIJB|nr:meteorin isoform X3 [Acinonyx jubatus]